MTGEADLLVALPAVWGNVGEDAQQKFSLQAGFKGGGYDDVPPLFKVDAQEDGPGVDVDAASNFLLGRVHSIDPVQLHLNTRTRITLQIIPVHSKHYFSEISVDGSLFVCRSQWAGFLLDLPSAWLCGLSAVSRPLPRPQVWSRRTRTETREKKTKRGVTLRDWHWITKTSTLEINKRQSEPVDSESGSVCCWSSHQLGCEAVRHGAARSHGRPPPPRFCGDSGKTCWWDDRGWGLWS